MQGRSPPPSTGGSIPLDRPEPPAPPAAAPAAPPPPRRVVLGAMLAVLACALAVGAAFTLFHVGPSPQPGAVASPGALHLVLNVDVADVDLDDSTLHVTNRTVEVPFLKPGPHTLLVRAPGRVPLARTVEVLPGQTVTARLVLAR